MVGEADIYGQGRHTVRSTSDPVYPPHTMTTQYQINEQCNTTHNLNITLMTEYLIT